jgi:glycine betaine catabolism A
MSQRPSQTFMTLPGRYYTDPAAFRGEMERLYWNDWVCAGRAETIPEPGDFFLRDLAGESIIITRDRDNSIRAFYNVCRHRGTRMCTAESGSFAGRIQCPYHGWTYSLDGRLLGAPHMDEDDFRREDYPLHSVHTGEWDGHIFVHLGNDPKPLSEHLGELPGKFGNWRMQELRMRKTAVYVVNANWKLIVSNYNECLHCPMLHPALNRLTDYLGADNETPGPAYIGGSMGFRDGAETMSLDGKRRRDYLPQLTGEQREMVAYYAIYPNLLLSLHPDYVMAHTLWPQRVDRTQVICEWYFHPTEMAKPDFVADDAIEFWDKTNREDWAISELSQAGIQSRAYSPGPYSRRESLLHAFDEYVLRRVADKKLS